MEILRTHEDLKLFRQRCRGSVGFVPTMGALHEGHGSLLTEARTRCDTVILSIFVNPTQFNDATDLAKYPRTFEADRTLAEQKRVDAIFYPEYEDLYPDHYNYGVHEKKESRLFCGAFREGHFDGVLTVVMKLFNLVRPDYAFFGEKDFQQLHLIQGMVDAFFMPLTIIPVPTLREWDGLAMSSRNVRLTADERKKAPLLYQILQSAPTAQGARQQLEQNGFRVDYVDDWQGRRLAAAFLGSVRLIDNVVLEGGEGLGIKKETGDGAGVGSGMDNETSEVGGVGYQNKNGADSNEAGNKNNSDLNNNHSNISRSTKSTLERGLS